MAKLKNIENNRNNSSFEEKSDIFFSNQKFSFRLQSKFIKFVVNCFVMKVIIEFTAGIVASVGLAQICWDYYNDQIPYANNDN